MEEYRHCVEAGVVPDPRERVAVDLLNGHCSFKQLDELLPVSLREMRAPKIYDGNFLLCRIVTEAELAVITKPIMEDLNSDEARMVLGNVTSAYDCAFPAGTIMAIKEPNTQSSGILAVTSPSDIVLVDETDRAMLEKLGALKWYKPETRSMEELRLAGNKCFSAGDFHGALKLYDRALRLHPDAAVVQLNKSAALLKLERFYEANDAAEKALEGGANREKALFRQGFMMDQQLLGQAAYGLRRWQKAVDHLVQLRKEFPSNADGYTALAKALARLKESKTGKNDMDKLYEEAIEQDQQHIDVADFVGPVEVVDIPGRGKGIVASEDITKGTLLIASKAIACIGGNNIRVRRDDLKTTTQVLEYRPIAITEALSRTLLRNPQWAKEFYSLHAGDGYSRDDVIPEGVIDVKRIHDIHRLNGFGHDGANEVRVSTHIVPSFINHSCMPNAYRAFYGDVIMVHAISDIRKGEEVVFNYTVHKESYEAREEVFSQCGFRCDCELCEADRADPRREERERVYAKYTAVIAEVHKDHTHLVAKIEPIIQKLRDTYADRSEHRLRLINPLSLLYDTYKALGRLEDRVRIAKEVLDCLGEPYLYEYGPDACAKAFLALSQLRIRAGDAGNWTLFQQYEAEMNLYLQLAREYVKVRSGMDLDLEQYMRTKKRMPIFPSN